MKEETKARIVNITENKDEEDNTVSVTLDFEWYGADDHVITDFELAKLRGKILAVSDDGSISNGWVILEGDYPADYFASKNIELSLRKETTEIKYHLPFYGDSGTAEIKYSALEKMSEKYSEQDGTIYLTVDEFHDFTGLTVKLPEYVKYSDNIMIER